MQIVNKRFEIKKNTHTLRYHHAIQEHLSNSHCLAFDLKLEGFDLSLIKTSDCKDFKFATLALVF